MVIHKYTEGEHRFLHFFTAGHTYKEIQEEFNKRFPNSITLSQVKSYIGRYKLNTGRTGRFEKGHSTWNKGMKGVCAMGCEKTWYKKGNLPHNTKPIGYERITKDGYIEVKIKMRPSHPKCNDNFKAKHHIVWEKTYGFIPKGHKIAFLDGDKQNCDLSNLVLITNAEHLEMVRSNLRNSNPEFTSTGVLIAKASVAVNKLKKENKNGKD